MNVWTIVMSQRLDDAENTRSMLISSALRERGHDVTMWTSAYDHIHKRWRHAGREAYLDESGIMIRFMHGTGYRTNIGPSRYVDHLLVARDFSRRVQQLPRPDIILANIPDHFTAYAAARYAARHDIPLVVDVRDKWPDVLYDHISQPLVRVLARLALTWDERKARFTLRQADAIVAMMSSFIDWGLDKAGRERRLDDALVYLNTALPLFDRPPPELPADNRVRRILATNADRFKVLFAGTFNRSQHPDLLIDAADHIARERLADTNEVAFLIGGGGLDERRVAERAAGRDNVHFLGWLNRAEIDFLAYHASTGVVAFMVRTEAMNNKTFAYLSGGKPILSSASGDLERLIEEKGIGLNFEAGNSVSLASAIIRLMREPGLHERLSANVRDFFGAELDRDARYQDYAALLERIAARRLRGTGLQERSALSVGASSVTGGE